MNKVNQTFVIIFLVSIFFCGCASSVKAPKWFNKPPQKKGYKYATGTEISDRRQSALTQARDEALAELARQLEVEVSVQTTRATEEVADKTTANVFTNALETMSSQAIKGYREVQTDVIQNGRKYEAFVLIELNMLEEQDRMLAELEKDKELMERLRASDLIKEMQKGVLEYRKRKGY